MLNSVTCSSRVLNFSQIGQYVWKAAAEANLRSYVKYGSHCADMGKIRRLNKLLLTADAEPYPNRKKYTHVAYDFHRT
jgi:hypothetical protein